MTGVTITPVPGIGEVAPGDSIARLVLNALAAAGMELVDGDIVAITHKIVSKAEGRVVALDGDEDAAYRELVAREAAAVVRRRGDLVIAVTEHGFVCANAGVDRSNTAPGTAVTLPRDPDASAHRIRMELEQASGRSLAVVITDTFGRAWRRGLADVAIGVSGMHAVLDLRGTTDAQGRELHVTEVAVADEVAAAVDLVAGKASGIPAVVVRGLAHLHGPGRARDLVRDPADDLFR